MTSRSTSNTPDLSVSPKLRQRARRLNSRLSQMYGSPRHGNKDDPLDELLFIILSQMTTGPSFNRVFDRLKSETGSWERLSEMDTGEVSKLISDAGLSNQKAPRMVQILERVRSDFGYISLDPLYEMSDKDAEAYLTSLPGVGIKTAKCVLMYSLGRQVLPVDTHVERVARRFELIPSGLSPQSIHKVLERVVCSRDRYSFHVNALAHGRSLCLAIHPRCMVCPLARTCPHFRSSHL